MHLLGGIKVTSGSGRPCSTAPDRLKWITCSYFMCDTTTKSTIIDDGMQFPTNEGEDLIGAQSKRGPSLSPLHSTGHCPALPYFILMRPALPCPALPCPALPCPAQPGAALTYLILLCHALSYPNVPRTIPCLALSFPPVPWPAQPRPALSYPKLSCYALRSSVLSYLVLLYPTLSYSAPP